MNKRNVIVVMLDSLGVNYVHCYGNPWIKTPNIDRLAKEGTLFENNYIENLPTVPCRRSMHTGRYGLHWRGWSPLELEETTIADLCWGRPIDTALVFDCPMYRLPKFGYTRGFDKVYFVHGQALDHEYYHTDPLIHLNPLDFIEDHVLETIGPIAAKDSLEKITDYLRKRQYWKTDEDQQVAHVMKAAVKYLENIDRNKSFFLWVDSFDPHEPWDPPSVYDPDLKCPYDPDYKGKDMIDPPLLPVVKTGLTEPEMHHIRMLMAEKVTNCDKWLGYLLDNIRKLGLEDDTLFLLVSDHGEPLENGEHGHGAMRKCMPWPYEELSHAPVIMRGPGVPAGKRVAGFTQSCDVAPTVTEWLGIGSHPSHTGKSLLPLARGEVDKVRDFAISGYWNRGWSIYTEDYSYFHWRKPEDKANFLDSGLTFGMLPGYVLTGKVTAPKMSLYGVEYVIREEGDTLVDAERRLRAVSVATDDAIWTSAAADEGDIPRNDELYDRKADPQQLQDIAAKDPKRAGDLYRTLVDFMSDLRLG